MNELNKENFHKLLDAEGLVCPEPVMLLHKAVKEIEGGEIVKVVATDPSTERDIPKFCLFLGHELVLAEKIDDKFNYLIRKKKG